MREFRPPENPDLFGRVQTGIELRLSQDIKVRLTVHLVDRDDAPVIRDMLLNMARVRGTDRREIVIKKPVVVVDLPREARITVVVALDFDAVKRVFGHHKDVRARAAHILFFDDPDFMIRLLQKLKQRLTDVFVQKCHEVSAFLNFIIL